MLPDMCCPCGLETLIFWLASIPRSHFVISVYLSNFGSPAHHVFLKRVISTRICLGWLPTGQKTSCWAVWIQEFSQPVQWQIQYLDLARSHSVEGFKTTSLCKGSSKIWSFVASESMSFAAPVQFSIIKLLFSASESFCFEAWLIRCFTGSRKDQKLKEQLTFTASGCHKFPWPGSQCVM